MDSMVTFQTLLLANLKSGDYVGFTFFIGSMAMMAASVFFFVEMWNQESKSGLSHLNFNIFYAANQQIFMDGYSKKLKPQRIFAVNTIQNLPS